MVHYLAAWLLEYNATLRRAPKLRRSRFVAPKFRLVHTIGVGKFESSALFLKRRGSAQDAYYSIEIKPDLGEWMASPQTSVRKKREMTMTDVAAPLTLALFQPDIPQNAGTMLRMCACLGVEAAIVEPAGFPTSDRHFRRSGMDYLDLVTIARHASFQAFEAWRSKSGAGPRRLVLLSTWATTSYLDCAYQAGDILMVGRESAGVPDEVFAAADLAVTIPMRPAARSLNVAVAAAMVLGEAIRQISAQK